MKTQIVLILLTITASASGFAADSAFQIVSDCKEADYVQGKEVNQINTLPNLTYSPKCLKVKVGAKVTIQASTRHPLAAMPDIDGVANPFSNSQPQTTAQTQTMTKPGQFGFNCDNHGSSDGSGMAGAILVEP